MTRQIRIVHHTGYSYPENVLGSHNEVRMTPRSTREQWVINSRIDYALEIDSTGVRVDGPDEGPQPAP